MAALIVLAGMVVGAPSGVGASAPGVSAGEIRVGSISTLSGPLASNFEAMVPGVEAYFDMVDARGGVNGRMLRLAYNLDDGGNPSEFDTLAHTLIDQDHAFAAVGIATAFFSPGYFVRTGTPAYGYNLSLNWGGAPNLFAANGSVRYLAAGAWVDGYLAHRLHASSIAVLAYGASASSAESCGAVAGGLAQRGFHVGYRDLNVQYPASGIASDVQRMRDAGTDMVISCMDVTGNIAMARAMQQYGLRAHQLWFSGDDQSVLTRYPSLMKGVYFDIGHVPFSAPTRYYPGLATYLSAMRRYEPRYVDNEVAVEGWESAALFVAGVRAAGSDLTRQNVIDQTNKLTDFTADGLTPPVDWAKFGHGGHVTPGCGAFIEARGDRFVPVFGRGHQVFLCFNGSPRIPVPVAPRPGTPGT